MLTGAIFVAACALIDLHGQQKAHRREIAWWRTQAAIYQQESERIQLTHKLQKHYDEA